MNPFKTILLIILLIPVLGLSQSKIDSLNGNYYGLWEGEWFTLIDGIKGDKIDLNHLIVSSVLNRKQLNTFLNTNFSLSVRIINGPLLNKYYKLKIKYNYDPFEIGRSLKYSGNFQELSFNVFSSVSEIEPDDSYYESHHWNLKKINMPQAWEYTTGSDEITVAVIDNGLEYEHSDLDINIDLDNSKCFVDDYIEYPGECTINTIEAAYHGTAVTGIIGAELNNNDGVSGIGGGWNGQKGLKIMFLKAGRNYIDTFAASTAIIYAVSKGAQVISGSFNLKSHVMYFQNAINYAYNEGVVLVFSSGNQDAQFPSTGVRYPAKFNHTISVGAVMPDDFRKPYQEIGDWGSCFGVGLDVVAPGVQIATTDLGGGYRFNFNGTSAAAPHVAALAGLILSINPNLPPDEVKDYIINNTDKVHRNLSLGYVYDVNGWNEEVGYGRINAYKTLKKVYDDLYGISGGNATLVTPTNLIVSNYYQLGQNVELSWNGQPGSTFSHYNIYRKCIYGIFPFGCDIMKIGETTSSNYTDLAVHIAYNDGTTEQYIYYVSLENTDGSETSNSNGASTWGESFFKKRNSDDFFTNTIPEKYGLIQNHPNPFNPITTISYSLPKDSQVRINIYNLKGQLVKTLVNKTQPAGYYTVSWNIKDNVREEIAAGIYLYRIVTPEFTDTKKLVVMK